MKDYIKEYLPDDKKHYCDRYIKIIEFYENIEVIEGENHHILPRKLFPELKEDFNNVVRLPYRAHYLVHWLLAKIFGSYMWFAFNMMSRVKHKLCFSSALYEQRRKYLRQQLKEMPRSAMSEENKRKISQAAKNTVVVKDEEGNTFRISREDPLYKNGTLKHYRVGYKHKNSTIHKMKENSPLRGTHYYTNNKKETIYLKDGEEIPDGFVLGRHPEIKELYDYNYLNQSVWVNIDGKNKRIDKDQVGEHTNIGRVNFINRGFEKVNNQEYKTCFDPYEWSYKLIHISQIKNVFLSSGIKLTNIKLYGYKNVLCFGYANFFNYCKQNQIFCPNLHADYSLPPVQKGRKYNKIKNDEKLSLFQLGYDIITYENRDKIVNKDYIFYNKEA